MAEGTQDNTGGSASGEPDVDGYVVITTVLLPEVAELLAALSTRTGMSNTDLANRALTWEEFRQRMSDTDHDFLIRDPATGRRMLVIFEDPLDDTRDP